MNERKNVATGKAKRRGSRLKARLHAQDEELERIGDEVTLRNLTDDRSAFVLRDLLSALSLSIGQLQRIDALSPRARTIVNRMDRTLRHAHEELTRRFPRSARRM